MLAAITLGSISLESSAQDAVSSITNFCSDPGDLLELDTKHVTGETGVTIVSCEGTNIQDRFEREKNTIDIPDGATIVVSTDELIVTYVGITEAEPTGPSAGKWSGGCKYGIVKGFSCKGKHRPYTCVNEASAGRHCAAINDLPCSWNVTLRRDNSCP